jgi:hypothetical protein
MSKVIEGKETVMFLALFAHRPRHQSPGRGSLITDYKSPITITTIQPFNALTINV